jgi:hypothetical protein
MTGIKGSGNISFGVLRAETKFSPGIRDRIKKKIKSDLGHIQSNSPNQNFAANLGKLYV